MDIARFPQGECITYQQVKKCMSGRSGMATGPERGGDRGVDPDPCVGTAGKRKAGEAHLGRLDLTGYRYGFRQVRGPRRAMGRSHQYGSSIKTTSLPNACQTLRKEGWRAPILEARRRVSPSNFQRPARPRPDFRTVEAIKRFTPRPPAPRTARPCPQGFQGPQVTPSPQLRADASTRSHISAHGWAALIRRRSSRAERANSAES